MQCGTAGFVCQFGIAGGYFTASHGRGLACQKTLVFRRAMLNLTVSATAYFGPGTCSPVRDPMACIAAFTSSRKEGARS